MLWIRVVSDSLVYNSRMDFCISCVSLYQILHVMPLSEIIRLVHLYLCLVNSLIER